MSYRGKPPSEEGLNIFRTAYIQMTYSEARNEERFLDRCMDGGHKCHETGRWWQCRRCLFDEALDAKRSKHIRQAWIAKGMPKQLIKTIVELDELKRRTEK